MTRKSPRGGLAARGAALVVAAVLDAVAFATVLRPRHGYTSAHGLLVALTQGVGVAFGALVIAGALTAVARRRHGSPWAAMTAPRTLGIVLTVFVTAAVGSQIVRALRAEATQRASATAERADFRRWQAAVVPIVVRWMDTTRTDKVFVHGLPVTATAELPRRVHHSRQTLEALARSLAADSPRLPEGPQLRRLTGQLATALAMAERAQSSYALALAAGQGVAPNGRASRARSLIERGNAEARRSLAIMETFSLDANQLGASLFVQNP
jgi:hypothetical protein